MSLIVFYVLKNLFKSLSSHFLQIYLYFEVFISPSSLSQVSLSSLIKSLISFLFSIRLSEYYFFMFFEIFSCLLKPFQAISRLIKSLSSPTQVLSSHFKVSLKSLRSVWSFSEISQNYFKSLSSLIKSLNSTKSCFASQDLKSLSLVYFILYPQIPTPSCSNLKNNISDGLFGL